jgi:outer membrane protein TolC
MRAARVRLQMLSAGLLASLGCSSASLDWIDSAWDHPNPPAVLARPVPAKPAASVTQLGYRPDDRPEPLPPPSPVAAPAVHHVPVSLDAVLHLAEEQNAQIKLAREKLHESEMDNEAAQNAWLPHVAAGVAYYRHEGGIQNEDGTLTKSSSGALFPGVEISSELDLREATYRRVNAERALWQQKGELRRITSDKLIDAAASYIDLLTAQRAGAVSKELERLQLEVLSKGEALQKSEGKPLEVVVETARAEVSSRRQSLAQMRQQAHGAEAKLAYLLGLPPEARLVPLDKALTPVDLVDASRPEEMLVFQALSSGPGVQELEGMLATIDHAIEQSESLLRFLPTFKATVVEGAFGAGPDSSLAWDNRFDACLSAKWCLNDLCTACGRRAKAESGRRQVELSLEDLRGGLAARVKEARAAVLEGREQIRHLGEQVQHAHAAYERSKTRFESTPLQVFSEVLQSIRSLEQAHMQYLAAVAAYNKAEVRLLVLLDGGCAKK